MPFGGMLVILAGDFYQKAPPGGVPLYVSPWCTPSIQWLWWWWWWCCCCCRRRRRRGEAEEQQQHHHHHQEQQLGPPSAEERLDLVLGPLRVNLVRTMRCRNDPEFGEVQRIMRDTGSDWPVPASFVDGLREVSSEDVAADRAWVFAPIAVLSQRERDALNFAQLLRFAKYFNLPLVRWRRELAGASTKMPKEDAEELYREEVSNCSIWDYFVQGAPVMLTENQQPSRGLANSSAAILDSLGWERSGQVPEALREARGFRIVELDEPPAFVNVAVGGRQWHGTALPDFSHVLDTDDDGAQVVPIFPSRNMQSSSVHGIYAAQKNYAKVY